MCSFVRRRLKRPREGRKNAPDDNRRLQMELQSVASDFLEHRLNPKTVKDAVEDIVRPRGLLRSPLRRGSSLRMSGFVPPPLHPKP